MQLCMRSIPLACVLHPEIVHFFDVSAPLCSTDRWCSIRDSLDQICVMLACQKYPPANFEAAGPLQPQYEAIIKSLPKPYFPLGPGDHCVSGEHPSP